MRAMAVPLSAWLAAACAGAPGSAPVDAPAPPAASRYVLVRDAAWLYSDALTTAARARAARPVGEAWPMRLVGEQGELVEVETLDGRDPAAHCHDGPPELAGWRLRLFVERSGLASAVTRAVDHVFPDGTELHLEPGVRVALERPGDGEGTGLFEVAAAGGRVVVPLPLDAVGTSYARVARYVRDSFPTRFVGVNARVTLAGEQHSIRALGANRSDDILYVEAEEPRGEGALVTLRARCVSYKVLVAAGDVEQGGVGGLGLIGSGRGGRFVKVRAGATVWWPDGRPAGTVQAQDFLPAPGEAVDGRRCFDKPVGAAADPRGEDPHVDETLRVCFDERDLSGGGPR